MKKWYAVQMDRTDAWDKGSFDYDEAIQILKNQGFGLIAVIEDDECVEEIEYNDIYDWENGPRYYAIWVAGNNDGKVLASFDDFEKIKNFARDFYRDHEDWFDPDCGGVAIFDRITDKQMEF